MPVCAAGKEACRLPDCDLLHKCAKCHELLHAPCAVEIAIPGASFDQCDFCPTCAPIVQQGLGLSLCSDEQEGEIAPVVISKSADEGAKEQGAPKMSATNQTAKCCFAKEHYCKASPKSGGGEQIVKCWNVDICGHFMHDICGAVFLGDLHKKYTEKKGTEEHMIPKAIGPDGNERYFCRYRCLAKFCSKKLGNTKVKPSQVKDGAAQTSWSKDGRLDVLLDWITTEDNYSSYCGGDSNTSGTSKATYHSKIAAMIEDETGIETNKDQVKGKIEKLEADFKKAVDWQANTGQGLDFEGKIRPYIENSLCRHYFLLEPIMKNRPNIRPPVQFDGNTLEIESDSDDDSFQAHSFSGQSRGSKRANQVNQEDYEL